jgi:hypothetical protein
MSIFFKTPRVFALLAATALAMSSGASLAKDVKVSLSCGEEMPPVTTSASGAGTIKIKRDKSVQAG